MDVRPVKSNFVILYMPIRWSQSLLIAAILLLGTIPTSLAQVDPGQTFSVRVVEVTDADTYDVRRSGGGQMTIRLHGGATPPNPPSRTAGPPRGPHAGT